MEGVWESVGNLTLIGKYGSTHVAPAEERQVTVRKCGHFGKCGSTFCKAIESHGNLWKESRRKVMEGHRRPWNVKEYFGNPWNTVGTDDREVECHGRPWNSHVTSVGIPAQPPVK